MHRLEARALEAWVTLDAAALAEIRVRRRAAIARLERRNDGP